MKVAKQTDVPAPERPRRGRQVQYRVGSGGTGRRRMFLGAAAAGGVGIAGVAWWWKRGGQNAAPAEDVREMAALAGVPPAAIQPVTSGIHVVYHATTPLPSAAQPRADGKVTLVWFSASW